MERTGIVLAIVVALSWGMADTVATLATRRQGTFVTTAISLMASVAVLFLFGSLTFTRLSLSPMIFVHSASLGLLTGILGAVGYYSLYRGLELGPLAIVSPVTAADGAVGAVLAVIFLHEVLSLWQGAMLVLIFVGIVVASTNIMEIRGMVRSSGVGGLVRGGTRWGLLAMVTFGMMLFGIGLSAEMSGWFAPIFWTRIYATITLFIFAAIRHYRRGNVSRIVTVPAGKHASLQTFGVGLAVIVGFLETAGLLLYSLDTQLASTGIASAISSSWGIIPLLAGLTLFRERPMLSQTFGVLLVLLGLCLLAIRPV